MSELVPVPIYPWPMEPARLELLKQAKALLDLPYKIVPVEAVPGSPGRVLAWLRPWWLCRYAPIKPLNAENVQSIAAALKFALEADSGRTNDRRFNEEHWLTSVMGVDVKYSHSEDDTGGIFYE